MKKKIQGNWILCFVFRLLTDMEIRNEEDAKAAMQRLHEMGAKTVVISSTDLGSQDVLVGFGSTVKSK